MIRPKGQAMTYERLNETALEYFPCRYGLSKMLFRGPRRKLEGSFCAILGGTETYGKFIPTPYPALLETMCGVPVVNFGCVHAGLDVYLNDPAVLEACVKARVTLVQMTGAQNTSNRYYSVHPRRNDRVLKVSTLLMAIYREVDFEQFQTVSEMLYALNASSPERFTIIVEEIRAAWVARMKMLLQKTEGKTVLVWMARHSPDDVAHMPILGAEPLFINRTMVEAVRPFATELVEVVASIPARAEGVAGMVFQPSDAAEANALLGPAVHTEVAEALAPVVAALV